MQHRYSRLTFGKARRVLRGFVGIAPSVPAALRHDATTPRRDIGAVRDAVLEPWSNGQTEGQITIGSAILHLLEHSCHDAEVTHAFTLA
jgi:hypothetical protein